MNAYDCVHFPLSSDTIGNDGCRWVDLQLIGHTKVQAPYDTGAFQPSFGYALNQP